MAACTTDRISLNLDCVVILITAGRQLGPGNKELIWQVKTKSTRVAATGLRPAIAATGGFRGRRYIWRETEHKIFLN